LEAATEVVEADSEYLGAEHLEHHDAEKGALLAETEEL
jgi:hypothetical protein